MPRPAADAAAARGAGFSGYIRCSACQGTEPASGVHPDEMPTDPIPALVRPCADCSAALIAGDRCRQCSEARRLLPRFVRLTAGRAYVTRLLADLDAAD